MRIRDLTDVDFTIQKYRQLVRTFVESGFQMMTVRHYLETMPAGKVVVLRHDVDEQPQNALKMATVEKEFGITATYYFRRVSKSDHPGIIRMIAGMGHEIGYHYEDLSSSDGNMDEAIASFSRNLAYFREYYPVKTVCMHGSSSSRFDNRTIWNRVSMDDFGIIGEPYLSFDFSRVYYLTDTGYAWDGGKYAFRDMVDSPFSISFHYSDEIIFAVRAGRFPLQSMILAHTLWTDNPFLWSYLHLRESVRNRVKLLSRNNRVIATVYNKIVKLYWK